MTLFDILAFDDRVIVWSDTDTACIITWNKSLTLQLWHQPEFGEDKWEEVDAQTLSETPVSFDAARKTAINWNSYSS
jgi:hypothetical protein